MRVSARDARGPEEYDLDRHHATTRRRAGVGLRADWGAHRLERVELLGDRHAQDCVLDLGQLGEGRRSQRSADPARGLRPARRIDLEAHPAGIAEEGGDGDVGDRQGVAEAETSGRRLAFQIVEHRRDLLLERAVDHLAVALLAPHRGPDGDLVEEAPDEDVAHARVGELLQPAGARPVGDVLGKERWFGLLVLEVLADHRGVRQHEIAVDQHRDAPKRTQLREPVVAEERHDVVDLVGHALHLQAGQDLADIRRQVAADDQDWLHGAFHVSTTYVYTYINEQAQTIPQDAALRRPLGAGNLRRLEPATRRPAGDAVHGGAHGRSRRLLLAVRPDGRDRLGRRRHGERAGRAHGPRPVDVVAHPAHAGGRRPGRDRHRRKRPAQAHGVADRERRASARGRPRRLAAGPCRSRPAGFRRHRPPPDARGRRAMKGVLDSRAAWITASAALAIMTIAYGAPLVVVVAMKQIAAELQTNRSGPAGAGSLSYVGAAFGGIVAGWLAGRLGIRPIVIFGSTMVAAGLLLSAFGGMFELYVGHGIFMGLFGTSCMFSPLLTYVSLWFERRRGQAVALIASGQAVAGAIWPPLLQFGIDHVGWRHTMLWFGGFVLMSSVTITLIFLHRAPVAPSAMAGG